MYIYFKIIAGVVMEKTFIAGIGDCLTKDLILLQRQIILCLDYYGAKTRVQFFRGCLKQDKVTFNHGRVVNIYIVYETVRIVNLSKHSSNDNYPTLENALFGPVSLTKNTDIDKYKYSGYGIKFDRKGSFSFPGAGLGKNVIIFGVDMSSSTNIDNRKKDILIFVKGSTQELEHTLSVEKCI